MKKLTAIIILAVGVAVSAFAQDPNVTPAGISVPDFVTSLVTNFATSHPWLAAALVVIGGLRIVFKPLVTAYENWVKSTPDTADDERLAKIEASVPYKWFAWLLDYAASIKVGPQSKQ